MALASSCERALLSSRLTLASLARCSTLSRTTTAPTIEVTPRTCLPLMPRCMATVAGGWLPVASIQHLLGLFRPQSQLVQFVVKGLQADAQDFRGAGLVVAGMGEGHHDQPPLRFFDRGAGRERKLRLVLRLRLLRQDRRQVLRLDERPRRENRGALDHVAQLAHVAGPRVLLDHPHRLLIEAGNRLLVALVELV